MSSDWISASAGVGGAFIGAAAAFGGIWWQTRSTAKAAEADARERAYIDLLATSQALTFRVDALLTLLKHGSGINGTLLQLVRLQRPIDARELHDWLRVDLGPLMDAWSRAWACASPRGVELSNELLKACTSVLAVFSDAPPATNKDKLRTAVLGVNTDELRALLPARLRTLAVARRDLADLVRSETGRPPAQLFLDTGAEHDSG